jgi:ribosomal protein S18 acetylase RimI-like enzyme
MRPRGAVRPLTVTDAAAYFDLRRRAHETDPQAFEPAVADDPGLSLTRIESALARDPQAAQACIVGAFTRQLVGALGLFQEPDARGRAQLWGLYVIPEQRRAGLGLSLLSAACDRARGMNGVERLQLRVAVACPEAIRLFERFGFERSGSGGATDAVGRMDDDLWMVLDLPDEAA